MSEENNETLNESDKLLQGTIDALSSRIAILDYQGNIIKTNRVWRSFVENNSVNNSAYSVGSNYLQVLATVANNSQEQCEPYEIEVAQGISEIIGGKRDSFELEYSCQIGNAQHWVLMHAAKFGEGKNLRVIINQENKTIRKLTEQALRESEESYRILAETASDVIIKINSDSVILFINHSCERVFGYKPAEMIGQPLTMIMPEYLRDSHLKSFKRYLQTQKRKLDWEGLEVPALHRDNHIFPLEISFGEFEQAGKHYFIGVARDITERKHTEKATAHLAAIVESSDDAIISKDLQGIITSWNKSAERVFGYADEEVIGKPGTTLIPPHLGDEEQLILERIRRGEPIEHYETVRRRKDGSDINVSITVSPIQDEAGNVVGASKIARDITERRQNEEILLENQMMLSLAMQSSRMGAWEEDIATGVVLWSEELEEIFGLEKNAFGQTTEALYELIHEDDRQRMRAEVERAINEHRDYTIEFRFYHAGGSIRWMEWRGQAVYSEKSKPVRIYGIGIDITERKMSEDNLRYQKTLLEALTESVLDGILIVSPEGRMLHFNQHFLDIWNFPEEIVQSQSDEAALKWAASQTMNPAAFLERVTNVYDQPDEEVREELPMKDGRVYERFGAPIHDGNTRLGWVWTFRDISERKRAEERLRESEEKFRNMANSISQFAWMADASGSIFWYNERWYEYTGTTFEEMQGWGCQAVHHPDYLEPVTGRFKQHISSGEPWEDTFPLRSKKGEYGWFLSRALPIRDENGKIIRWFGTNTDITERKQAQEALIIAERKAAEDYQALLSRIVPLGQVLGTARDLISVYRALHEFVSSSMNCSAFFVSFYDAENYLRTAAYVWGEGDEVDIAGLPPIPLTIDGGANSQAVFQKKTIITNHYWKTMENRPHVVFQENGTNPNSSLVVPMMIKNEVIGTLEVQAHENEAFSQEQAVALEMVANLAAVAIENVRLLEVEANARQVAEEANRAKDEFLSVLSHEMRTPLNAIFGWTRMLKSGGLNETLKNQAIETIERNARLQNDLIEDLLDVSRIISGKMRLDCEKIDFVSIVESCVETARPLAQEKDIEFAFYTQTASQNIFGDTTRIQQIVNNLLNNAIKFTPTGGRISVSLSLKNEKIQLQIVDTGIGISEAFLPFIFDRFKQADSTTKRSYSGLGLGLTIVRHLTELHGGHIKVSSEGENLGSTFVIELPLAKAETEQSAPINGYNSAANSKLKGAKILLVDDDFDGLQPLQIFLENQQADVSCAFSAQEALRKIAEEERFDILISDIGMPEMDGFELIAEVRKLTNHKNYLLPAIALTAYASSQDRERVLSSGYQTHLSKPVDFEEFLLTISNLLNNSNEE